MIKSIIKSIKSIFTKREVEMVYVEVKVEVLSAAAFERLSRQLEPPIVSASDTAHTTGYKLGIQRALTAVQKGFAV